ncbi:nucleoside-diphosphate sugar epimerase/dehydratase [Barrientosiimonas marina]|uniref:Polysaccharide biosynthesis protein n=1 Tax=Lentibacillus kimchii TaxID=1542911 RepID=A0ABW2UTK4_9BACI
MTYRTRLLLLMFLDSVIVSTALFIAAWVTYRSKDVFQLDAIVISAVALLISHHLFAAVYKLYHKVWAYASVGELLAIVKSVTLSIIVAGLVQMIAADFTLYSRALLVTWLLHVTLIGGSRFVWRVFHDRYIDGYQGQNRTLIVGAGAAGTMVARQLHNRNEHKEIRPIAFVDDDMTKQRMEMYGIPVLGRIQDVPAIVDQQQIDLIVIAIPSLANGELNTIVNICSQADAKVQLIPKLEDLLTGRVEVSSLKNVDEKELLGRAPVELDIDAISQYVSGRTVLVTGAGGSIGSELCRQLMPFQPGRLLLVGHDEFSIYQIHMELKDTYDSTATEFVTLIGDVRDKDRMYEIVQQYAPAIIYHAAAHKHVPLMEYNPHEAVKNNVIGTKNMAEAADAFNVNTFVLISTDKAVRPTNVMGATKRITEIIIQHLNQTSQTTFAAVRFGNVLGSSGSVIPLFKDQIARGGPVTVTDPDMVRYFMTIPEASRLVIQAGTLARGGEIFVLDMGEPVRIVDLARNLIKLSGYTETEIGIEYSGIRPGEKMFEEPLSDDEVHPGEVYEKIYVGRTLEVDPRLITRLIEQFSDKDDTQLKEALMTIVHTERTELAAKGS